MVMNQLVARKMDRQLLSTVGSEVGLDGVCVCVDWAAIPNSVQGPSG